MGYWKSLTEDHDYQISSRKLICKECNTEFTVERVRETIWDGTHDWYDTIIKDCSCGQCKE